MPKRSNQFQRLVALINQCLAHDVLVTESKLIPDIITGESREVDIVLSGTISDYPVSIGIEVSSKNRKADTTWVESMYGKHQSLPLDKLVLVSERGFTKPALKKAAHYGIETIKFENALQTDWELVTKLTAKGIFELTSFKCDCTIVFLLPDGSKDQIDVPARARIRTAGSEIALDQFIEIILNREEVKEILYTHIESTSERQYWFSYMEPNGILEVEIDDVKTKALELRVSINIEQTKTPVTFAHGKYRETLFLTGTPLKEESNPEQDFLFLLVKEKDGIFGRLIENQSGFRTLLVSNNS